MDFSETDIYKASEHQAATLAIIVFFFEQGLADRILEKTSEVIADTLNSLEIVLRHRDLAINADLIEDAFCNKSFPKVISKLSNRPYSLPPIE